MEKMDNVGREGSTERLDEDRDSRGVIYMQYSFNPIQYTITIESTAMANKFKSFVTTTKCSQSQKVFFCLSWAGDVKGHFL